MGGAIMGDGEGRDREKGKGSVYTPGEVPANFSAMVAPMHPTKYSYHRNPQIITWTVE